MGIDELTVDSFRALLGTRFRVRDPASGATLELELYDARSRDPSGNPFSAFFQGPRAHFLRQATYRLQHDTLGELTLFICPIAESPGGYLYEAVFNRLPARVA